MKKLLTSLLIVMMVVCFMPTMAFAEPVADCQGGENCTEHVAAIGTTHYDTLADAISAVGNGETIKLIADVINAEGMTVASGKNFTVDFNGKTYTITGPGAGSTNTDTNGFQLLKDSTITFKNGTINLSENVNRIYRIIQNYANLTLENLRVEAAHQLGGEHLALSFNNGTIKFKGNTNIVTTEDSTTAFDVYYWSDYPNGTTVIVEDDFTGNINGKILYDTSDASKATLTIGGKGTFGGIVLSTDAAQLETKGITITGGTFNDAADINNYLVTGTKLDNGTVVPDTEDAVAQIGNVAYPTLQGAINAAGADAVVTLLNDIELAAALEVAADDRLTIDLAGYIISYNPATAGTTYVVNNAGDLTIKDSSDTNKNGTGTGKITSSAQRPDDQIIPGYASNTLRNGGKLTVESGIIENTTADGSACYAIDTAWYSNSNAVHPTITINGGKITAVKPAIRLIGYATEVSNNLIVNGGEITGYRAMWIHLPGDDNNAHPKVNVDINGGTLTATNAENNQAIYSYSFGDGYEGVAIDITGGTFNGDVAMHGGSSYGGTGAESLEITGGTFNNVYAYGDADKIKISGGSFAFDVKDYMVSGSKEYKKGDAFIVATSAPANTSGYEWKEDTTLGYYVESKIPTPSTGGGGGSYTPPVTNTTTSTTTTPNVDGGKDTTTTTTTTNTVTGATTTVEKTETTDAAGKPAGTTTTTTTTTTDKATGTTTTVEKTEVKDAAGNTSSNTTTTTQGKETTTDKAAGTTTTVTTTTVKTEDHDTGASATVTTTETETKDAAGTTTTTTTAGTAAETKTEEGKVTATVDETTTAALTAAATQTKADEVHIDATTDTKPGADAATAAEVTLPTDMVETVAEQTEAAVVIKNDVAEVKLDNAAVAAVAEQAAEHETDTVTLIVKKVDESHEHVEVDLLLQTASGQIHDFKGGNVTVTVDVPKAIINEILACLYTDDAGHKTKMKGDKTADGRYAFNTGHFSTYTIMTEEEADAQLAAQDEKYAKLKAGVENTTIKAKSKLVKTKAGKKAIKITWTKSKGYKVDYYEVFKSTKRSTGYGKKAYFTTKSGSKTTYTNNKGLKKGTRYYFYVRGVRELGGEKVYTKKSNKVYRLVK